MTFKRMISQMRFWMCLGRGDKRAKYAKKKKLFAEIGEQCWLPSTLPLYPKLVKIHNNVCIHRSVVMVTHDRMNNFLMKIPGSYQFKNTESLSPIEIMDNVYIGMNCVILGNVRIGPNAIVNAGSVVATDVPPNSIVAGNPAKVIGKFDIYSKTRVLIDKNVKYEFERVAKEAVAEKAIENAWEAFNKRKNKEQRAAKPAAKEE